MKILFTIIFTLVVLSCTKTPEKTFSDQRDKSEYHFIEDGNKIWMTDNLSYLDAEIYNNGAWLWNCEEEDFSKVKKGSYLKKFVLYDWETAKNYCPEGWHLPSIEEWKDLIALYSADNPDSPGLDKLNFSFDGHARMFNKFCIFDGNTYWTRDSSESDQMAITIAIQHSMNGGIICNHEVTGIHNAFYVRCIKNKE